MSIYFVYFHGFASGPASKKGELLKASVFERVDDFICPDLNGDDFYNLSMPEWFERAEAAIPELSSDDYLIVSGSSLGAYTAAMLYPKLKQRIQADRIQLLLLAPAFGFAQRWSHILGSEQAIEAWRTEGQLSLFHYAYNEERLLSFAFYESCQNLPAFPEGIASAGSIIHGLQDEVLDTSLVETFAQQHPHMQAHFIDDDHALLAEHSQELIRSEALRLVDLCR